MANTTPYQNTRLSVGDTLNVHYRLIEKEKVAGKTKREVKEEVRERVQVFEGILLSIGGMAESRNILVRKIASGNIGVERIFPLNSPWIKKITVKKHAKVRRAKLYYLRHEVGRKAEQLKEKGKIEKAVEVKPVKEETKTVNGAK